MFGFDNQRLQLHTTGPRPSEDAIWLAEFAFPFLQHMPPGHLLDAGCGCGPVGLMLLTRLPAWSATGADTNPTRIAESTHNAHHNGLAARWNALPTAIEDLTPASFSQPINAIVANPPFYKQSEGHQTAHPTKAGAHMADDALLARWLTAFQKIAPTAPWFLVLHTSWEKNLTTLAPTLGRTATLTPHQTHPTRPAKRLLAHLTPR